MEFERKKIAMPGGDIGGIERYWMGWIVYGGPGRICLKKGGSSRSRLFLRLAGLTGLEPATSGVTGRCCNRLYYSPLSLHGVFAITIWWAKQGSNL